jgi:hypothetical protein
MTDEEDRPTTLYEILGVSRGASEKEIQAAFRELALDHHPDVADGRETGGMKILNHARETLLDEEKRAAYDAKLEQMEIEPWDYDPDQDAVRQQVAPREDEMSYMVGDDWLAAERGLPQFPFDDLVANLALQSWAVRAFLLSGGLLAAGWIRGTGTVDEAALSGGVILIAVVAAAAVLDVIRTRRLGTALEAEPPTITSSHLHTPVALAMIGAGLWTGGLVAGGAPGGFAQSVLVPLLPVGAAVAVGSWLLGMSWRYATVHGALWGVTVSLPFASSQSAFVPSAALPVAPPADMLLGVGIGGLALFCTVVGGLLGAARLSRWAWELRYRNGRSIVPQAWEAVLLLGPLVGGLSLLADRGATATLATRYGVDLPVVDVSAATVGLWIVWTVPVTWVALVARGRVDAALGDGDR